MKILCVGRNYALHAKELGNEVPSQPVIFLKPETAILKSDSTFYLPPFSNDIHHELEIIVRINKVGKSIQPQFAHRYYDKVSLGIDFTARDLQQELKQKGLPWEISKGFDHSAVIGEWQDIGNVNLSDLDFYLNKNTQLVQKGNSKEMLFHIDTIISYISQFYTLKSGDIIFTGTPAGVGPVVSGDLLEAYMNNTRVLSVHIK